MATCEYRVTISQARENFSLGLKGEVAPKGAIVSAGDPNTPLCQVKLNDLSSLPVCELPDFAGEVCPIARFQRKEFSLAETNARLKEIFKSQ